MTNDNVLINHILDKIKHNQDYKLAVIGECGNGKSYACLRMAELLDPTFTLDRLVFHGEDFLRLLNSELPKGAVIIWDEASTGLDARNFMMLLNKLLDNVLVTMRHRNIILMISVPSTFFVDKRARELMDGCIDMRWIDRKKKKSVGKFYVYRHYHAWGKTYLKTPVAMIKGEPRELGYLRFSLPSEPLRQAYEKKKNAFTMNLNRETLKQTRELLRGSLPEGFEYIDDVVRDLHRETS